MVFDLSHQQAQWMRLVEGGRYLIILIAASALLAIVPMVAVAADPDSPEKMDFEIPRQRADLSLTRFAEQADITLIFAYDLARGKTTNRLVGTYTAREAIELLLAETGLHPTFGDDDFINIAADDKSVAEGDRMNTRKKAGFVASIAAIFSAGAGAQDSAITDELESEADDKVSEQVRDEIIVTATRREENIQDVPLAVEALTGAELEQRQVFNTDDILRDLVGVTATSNRVTRDIGIRGISSLSTSGGSATVSYYLDEIAIGRLGNFPSIATFDLDRLEVLRGPQGTLFGEGSLGGAIRYITKQPNLEEFEAKVEMGATIQADGEPGYVTNGVVNLPLAGGRAALRVGVHWQDQGGYVDRADTMTRDVVEEDVDGFDIEGVRANLLFEANDRLRIAPGIVYQKTNGGFSSSEDLDLERASSFSGNIGSAYEHELTQPTLVIDYDMDWATLTSATAFHDAEWTSESQKPAGDFFGNLFFYNERQVLQQEFRLLSNSDSSVNWVAGIFYRKIEEESGRGNNLFTADRTHDEEELAVYATVTWQATDNLRFDIGARFSGQEIDEANERVVFGSPSPANSTGGDDTIVNPRVAASYDFNEDVMMYASVARGYRSIFINEVSPPGSEQAGPDTLWSYELGFKSVLADGDVVFNAVVYHIDWDDIQVQSNGLIDPALGPVPFNLPIFAINGGKAHSNGLEVQLQWQATEGLSFGLTGSVTDAEFDEDIFPNFPTFFATNIDKGNKLKRLPEYQVTGSARYAWSLQGDYQMGASLSGRLTGSAFGTDTNDPSSRTDSYHLLDFSLDLERHDWSLSLYVNNIADSKAEFDINENFGTASRARPRVVGLSFRRSW